MEIALLNSLVVTVPGFYKAEKITLEDAQPLKHGFHHFFVFFCDLHIHPLQHFFTLIRFVKGEGNTKVSGIFFFQSVFCGLGNEVFRIVV